MKDILFNTFFDKRLLIIENTYNISHLLDCIIISFDELNQKAEIMTKSYLNRPSNIVPDLNDFD